MSDRTGLLKFRPHAMAQGKYESTLEPINWDETYNIEHKSEIH